jgi:hypothetical protein
VLFGRIVEKLLYFIRDELELRDFFLASFGNGQFNFLSGGDKRHALTPL